MIESSAILKWMWGAFGIYWLIAARGTKRIEVSETVWFRVLRLGILLITFVLLLSPWLGMGWVGGRFASETAIGGGAGLPNGGAGGEGRPRHPPCTRSLRTPATKTNAELARPRSPESRKPWPPG